MAGDTGDNQKLSMWAMADLVTPMAVRVAATLRIGDHLAQGPRTAAELAPRVGAHHDALERVLRHLVTAGVLNRDGDGGYTLTGFGEQLRSDHPSGTRAWIDLDGAIGRGDLCFGSLLHTVRTGEAAYPEHFGTPFWDDLSARPALGASFDTLMSAQSADTASLLAAAYDWAALGEVVDVGGGAGTLLIELLRTHPNLRGTVLDLPGPAAAAERALHEAGLAERGRTVSGSFFDPLPEGAGGYLLALVIHDWSDEEASTILGNCAAAAGPAGRVLLVEAIGTAAGQPGNTEMDLRMLAYCNGRERSLDQLTELADAAGLRIGSVTPVTGRRSLVELLPAA
ncbi:methyltransferase [Amycolatopsis aidingensis]|uniref:methyltransferase n=1 Tax=Amycolatopsis aidingensis TaxID=2842453 RepID=UPI001C0DF6E7|nr:methyltransferase [Amycolatopsis aidingensis]